MNILYIDHYAGSVSMGMEFRPYYFAREWQKLGHRVRVIGASFSHLRKQNPTVTRDFEIQSIDGVEFQWIRTGSYEGNGAARAKTMAEFCGKLALHAKTLAHQFRPDVVIASSTYPMDTYPAQMIRKYTGHTLLVHEIHDMWPLTLIEMYNMSPKNPFVAIVQRGEDSFCRHADRVVSVLPMAADYLVEHGMRREIFRYVPNGITLEDWEKPEALPEEHAETLRRARQQGRFVLCFFGSHTRSYNLDVLLKAAKEVGDGKLFLAFVGSGIMKEELQALAQELGLERDGYAFLPPVPKRAIPSLLAEVDASYVSIMKNGLNRFGIGMNKLFDAMMGAKPILYAVEAPNNLIEEYGCGVSVEPENVDALREGIEKLIALDEEARTALGERGREAVIKHFSYPALAQRFLDALGEGQRT